jgi:hypothetical protein
MYETGRLGSGVVSLFLTNHSRHRGHRGGNRRGGKEKEFEFFVSTTGEQAKSRNGRIMAECTMPS